MSNLINVCNKQRRKPEFKSLILSHTQPFLPEAQLSLSKLLPRARPCCLWLRIRGWQTHMSLRHKCWELRQKLNRVTGWASMAATCGLVARNDCCEEAMLQLTLQTKRKLHMKVKRCCFVLRQRCTCDDSGYVKTRILTSAAKSAWKDGRYQEKQTAVQLKASSLRPVIIANSERRKTTWRKDVASENERLWVTFKWQSKTPKYMI